MSVALLARTLFPAMLAMLARTRAINKKSHDVSYYEKDIKNGSLSRGPTVPTFAIYLSKCR
jgi:hypothetical protein